MSFKKTLCATAAIGAVAAVNPAMASVFSLSDAENIEQVSATKNGFTGYLTREYKKLTMYERDEMVDWHDAEHFADKAIAAAEGQMVAAAMPEKWDIDNQTAMRDLKQARADLYAAYENGARTGSPELAAIAQVHYDCWVEQEEEGWQIDHIAACKADFYDALAALNDSMIVPAATPAVPEPAFDTVVAPLPKSIVFFDFDSAEIEPEAMTIIDRAAEQIKAADAPSVEIIGHADRSGPVDYNRGLSMDRAVAVQGALSERGVTRATVESLVIRGFGESDTLVETADGVREPANRRVEIQVETVQPALVSQLNR